MAGDKKRSAEKNISSKLSLPRYFPRFNGTESSWRAIRPGFLHVNKKTEENLTKGYTDQRFSIR
jgi:hypothetical protein